MKKKILSVLSVLLVAMIVTSTASAGGNVGLNRLAFQPASSSGTTTLMLSTTSESFQDSLTATGKLTGLGGYKKGVIVDLSATGDPVISCSNQGGNEAPGQNPSQITAAGNQSVEPQDITKNGTAPMGVTAVPEPITPIEAGCPNNNWTAQIVSVDWTNAEIFIHDAANGNELLHRKYSCNPAKQTDTVVICTETNQ